MATKIITREQAGEDWKNWIWQQQNAVTDVRQLKNYFTAVEHGFFNELYSQSGERLKFRMTPYMLSQISRDVTREGLQRHPWAMQFLPLGDIYVQGYDAYDGTDNWEDHSEFPTSNLHHKYTNRALIRLRTCFAYCNYCFEALGVLEKNPSPDKLFKWDDWQQSLDYIARNPNLEEVILSGGEPLLLSDAKLKKILSDIESIRVGGKQKVRFKRIHTRTMTHNPYRITEGLIDVLREYKVNAMNLHVAHPSEMTSEFLEGVDKIRDSLGHHAPMLALCTPLLRGINDDADVLWELFSKAYENNIRPYGLYHSMPHIPYADRQRVPVRKGVEIMRKLKRHKSNNVVPEFTIVHKDGKQTVPLEPEGTPEFQYTRDVDGNPIIRFKNWKGNWVDYMDAMDAKQ